MVNDKARETRAKNLLRKYPDLRPEFYTAIPGVGPDTAERMKRIKESRQE